MTGHWPTFAELQQYLAALGFTVGAGRPGYVACEHPTDDCWFVFIDREPDSPARETELLNVRGQLTHRGFVTDDEFARFWNPRARRAETPAPAVPQ